MNTSNLSKDWLYKLEGYYLIPHELLHVLAYRLLGKPYHYEWGDHRVTSSASLNRREELFMLSLPFVVCWVLGLFFHFVWLILALSRQMPPEAYFTEAPLWHFAFPALATLLILYSGTGYCDVRWVLRLLSRKDQPQQDSHDPHNQAPDQ